MVVIILNKHSLIPTTLCFNKVFSVRPAEWHLGANYIILRPSTKIFWASICDRGSICSDMRVMHLETVSVSRVITLEACGIWCQHLKLWWKPFFQFCVGGSQRTSWQELQLTTGSSISLYFKWVFLYLSIVMKNFPEHNPFYFYEYLDKLTECLKNYPL